MPRHLCTLLVALILFIYGCDQRESRSGDANAEDSTARVQDMIFSAKHAAELSCHIGEVDSGAGCNTVINDPNKPSDSEVIKSNRSITCGYPGEVSKISWEFVEHREGKDVYRFERTFPYGESNSTTTSKAVEYKGVRTIIFEDDCHVVVLDMPK